MNVGAFIVVTEAAGYEETLRTVEDYQGLALRRPVLAGLLAFFLLSLIGIPFTGGFFGKFYVFASALQAGHVWLAVVGLINSGVACYYYLRLLASVYTRRGEQTADTVILRSSMSVPAGLALALTAAATLMLGVMPGRVLHLADYASWMLQPSQSAASDGNGNASAAEAGAPAVQR
jgi:NADH-quinone oxidoreductase subunit N